MSVLRRLIHGKSAAVGLAVVSLAFGWQALRVRYDYRGNWTGLYCTGATQSIPRHLISEDIYALPTSAGYDGQFYHYVAHDPLGRGGLAGYVDTPGLRYGRILVPGLAYLLAAGQARFVDAAYFAVVLLFVFLGAYWVSRFAEIHGRHPAWGLLFLVLPGVLISVDRMTVDVALCACWAGFAVCNALGRNRGLWLLLALAPLARETGLVLAVAYGIWTIGRREYARAGAAALATLPFAAWWLYVQRTFESHLGGWIVFAPLKTLFMMAAGAMSQPWNTVTGALVTATELLAVLGSLAAVALAFRVGSKPAGGVLGVAMTIQGALGLLLVLFGSSDVWIHAYGHGRLFSPLLALLALRFLERGTLSALAPAALLMPRVGLQLAGDAWHMIRSVTAMTTG